MRHCGDVGWYPLANKPTCDAVISLNDHLCELLNKKNIILSCFMFLIDVFKNSDKFQLNSHSHDTSNRQQYILLDFHRLCVSQGSLSFSLPSIYNKIPNDIKSLKNVTFSKQA